jgi:hypothetical protein
MTTGKYDSSEMGECLGYAEDNLPVALQTLLAHYAVEGFVLEGIETEGAFTYDKVDGKEKAIPCGGEYKVVLTYFKEDNPDLDRE